MKLADGVVVIDDNPRRRDLVCSILATAKQQVLGAKGNGLAAAGLLQFERPRLVFFAFEEPYQRAAHALANLAEALPGATIIAYSSSDTIPVFQQAVRSGAKTLLVTPFGVESVSKVIEAVFPSLPKNFRPGGRIVAVVGQKGGIGKTTISVNLATVLAKENQNSVLIVDFDTTFGDVALGLNIEPNTSAARVARTFQGMNRDEFRQELIPHESGAFVLPAPARMGEWLHVNAPDLQDLVSYASEMFDYVLVDTPGAYNDAVAAGLEIADHALVVSSLELTSAKNTSLLMQALRAEGYREDRAQIIANHTVRDTGFAAIDLSEMLERPVWEVPFDPQMRRSTQNGTPITGARPDAPASLSLRALASRLATEPDRIERRRRMRDSRLRQGPPAARSRFAFGFPRRRAS